MWAAACAAGLLLAVLGLRRRLLPRQLGTILGLRLAAFALLLVVLVQPSVQHRERDRRQFSVALIGDVSASMLTADCAGGDTRLARLRRALDPRAPDALLPRLERDYRVRVFLTTDQLTPYRGPPVDVLPGRTALGDALGKCLDANTLPDCGAVLLLSDGNSNAGLAPEDAARQCRAAGLPVSCVGFGTPAVGGETTVRFTAGTWTGVKGAPLTLEVAGQTTGAIPARGTLTVSLGPDLVQKRTVTLAPGDRETRFAFAFTPLRAGYQTATARFAAETGPPPTPGADVDFAAVKVQEPPQFRILYLGAHLGWEYKFIQASLRGQEQLQLAAVIKTGPASFFAAGLPAAPGARQAFPVTLPELQAFDALIVDVDVFAELPESAAAVFAGFVADRGGGLLAIGSTDTLRPEFLKILPAAPRPVETVRQPLPLDFAGDLVFDRDRTGILTAAPGLKLPSGARYTPRLELKPGARAAATLGEPEQALLPVHLYGSGRVALLGTQDTWRWHLANTGESERHTVFWRDLLVWLASSSKPRLSAPGEGRKAQVDAPFVLALDVTTAGFQPAIEAAVRATVAGPTGPPRPLTLEPDGEHAGRYAAHFVPEEAGEYRVSFNVELAGEQLHLDSRFAARATDEERRSPQFREKTLRDVARLSGGQYWDYRDLSGVRDLPISQRAPLRLRQVRWLDSIWLLAAAVGFLCLDWYARRRLGLR